MYQMYADGTVKTKLFLVSIKRVRRCGTFYGSGIYFGFIKEGNWRIVTKNKNKE
jgi:3-phenylpropionate/cinnamic acid dioxygenase small subunit